MFKEIQSVVSGEKPGTEVAVGKLQDTETAPAGVQNGVDPETETEKLQTAAGDCGTCTTACQAGCDFQGKCGFFAGAVILLIRVYQKLVAPLLPECCRFEPTCSHYAVQALQIHGLWKGTLLTIWRLMRCQPFCKGGYDPVPEKGLSNPKTQE